MPTNNSPKIFINLAVHNLKRSMDFFGKVGFQFNPEFTDDKAASMIVSEHVSVMLLSKPFFSTFTKRKICDTRSQTEGLFALSCTTRAEVDEIVEKALANGGERTMEPQDHGFMYGRSFYDPDGHHWEVLWMDPRGRPEHQKQA